MFSDLPCSPRRRVSCYHPEPYLTRTHRSCRQSWFYETRCPRACAYRQCTSMLVPLPSDGPRHYFSKLPRHDVHRFQSFVLRHFVTSAARTCTTRALPSRVHVFEELYSHACHATFLYRVLFIYSCNHVTEFFVSRVYLPTTEPQMNGNSRILTEIRQQRRRFFENTTRVTLPWSTDKIVPSFSTPCSSTSPIHFASRKVKLPMRRCFARKRPRVL